MTRNQTFRCVLSLASWTSANELIAVVSDTGSKSRGCFDARVGALLARKRFGKSKDEIEAAIAKVGGNAETLIKELRVSD